MEEFGGDDYDFREDDDLPFVDEDVGDDPFLTDDAYTSQFATGGTSLNANKKSTPTSVEAEGPPPITNIQALFPKAPATLMPVVVSVITQVRMGVGIDLRKLSCGARNVEFTPKRVASAIMRLKEPACVCMIRNSGSISVVGAVSTGASKQAAELCVRIIRRVLDLKDVQGFTIRVRSVMARFDCCHPIRLDTLQQECSSFAHYEPETFCACVVKLEGPKDNKWTVTCNVYVSGKVTMIGARSPKELMAAFYTVLPLLAKHACLQ